MTCSPSFHKTTIKKKVKCVYIPASTPRKLHEFTSLFDREDNGRGGKHPLWLGADKYLFTTQNFETSVRDFFCTLRIAGLGYHSGFHFALPVVTFLLLRIGVRKYNVFNISSNCLVAEQTGVFFPLHMQKSALLYATSPRPDPEYPLTVLRGLKRASIRVTVSQEWKIKSKLHIFPTIMSATSNPISIPSVITQEQPPQLPPSPYCPSSTAISAYPREPLPQRYCYRCCCTRPPPPFQDRRRFAGRGRLKGTRLVSPAMPVARG